MRRIVCHFTISCSRDPRNPLQALQKNLAFPQLLVRCLSILVLDAEGSRPPAEVGFLGGARHRQSLYQDLPLLTHSVSPADNLLLQPLSPDWLQYDDVRTKAEIEPMGADPVHQQNTALGVVLKLIYGLGPDGSHLLSHQHRRGRVEANALLRHAILDHSQMLLKLREDNGFLHGPEPLKNVAAFCRASLYPVGGKNISAPPIPLTVARLQLNQLDGHLLTCGVLSGLHKVLLAAE
mmetsp:Transcript_981/g.2907  ORF Transcript_981/g.2907 Transcript_981/m.2907 type:complete len:236 (-) Transcript_981:702-1409(-)